MTNGEFIKTPAGEAFRQGALAADTSPAIMEAIAFLANSTEDATTIWHNPTRHQRIMIVNRATQQGALAANTMTWGGQKHWWVV